MHAHLLANNAFSRSQSLETHTSQTQLENERLAENLDRLIGEAGDIGDKRCRRRRPQWYSIELVRLRLEVATLQHYLNGIMCGKDRTLATYHKLALIQKTPKTSLPTDPVDVTQLLATKQALLDKAKEKSAATRQDMLSTHAETLDQQHAKAKASVVKRIKHHESSAAIWRTLAHMSSNGNPQTLDRLEIPASWPEPNQVLNDTDILTQLKDPKTTTAWQIVTIPSDIEHYLLLRNRIHFGQAHGTPFTIEPLLSHLDWTASLPAADEILAGSHIPSPELSALCKSVLLECKAVAALDALPAALSPSGFSGKIKKWREATTTSPSGRHLGRYKALFATGSYIPDPDDNGQGAFEVFEAKQAAISELILRLINFCIDTGHVLERWKQIVNTMIFKDTRNYRIHRLRVIHIYEADFNLLLAVKWRELLHAADRAGVINPGQYGG